MNNHSSMNPDDSQALLNKIVLEHLRDNRRKRIWRWISRILIIFFLLWASYQLSVFHAEDLTAKTTPHVGLIDIKGTIFENQIANSDNFMKALDSAYQNKALKALVFRIDSPGGSPVQADYMYNAIRFYQKKYPTIKTYAVCVDVCASAAYYIAAAADEIYASPASIVGSIGVLYNGFGFVDTLNKLGMTRRLHTAGQYKGFMDPFLPEQPGQEQILQTMLDLIHQQFIAKVKEGRGARLSSNQDLFSGLFWTGEQAKQLGLIDGFASSGQLVREKLKMDKVVDYTYQETMFERVAKTIGTAIANQLPTAMGMKPGIQ